MVQRQAEFKRRMAAIPELIQQQVRGELQIVAQQIVGQMRGLNPLPDTIEIDWTWGRAPKGSLTVGRVARQPRAGLFITIYATARTETETSFGAIATWFEFGTQDRTLKQAPRAGHPTGRITPQPFFFPVYRAERRRARARITRAVRRALKKA